MMKIILLALNSSYVHTNLAVRCIKKSLTDARFDADFLEFTVKDRYRAVLSALVEADADIYGFSTYIWNRREMLSLAADLKKLLPKAKIVFGGPEVSFDLPELIDSNRFIDHVIAGEGEAAFVELARKLERGEAAPQIIEGAAGDEFTNGGILYTPDELVGEKRMLYYESSRGCPYRCAYCLSALSGRVRAKPAEQTLAELLEFERLSADIRVIKLVDRTFNFDVERAKKIWRGLLDGKYTKSYHFEICAELIDDESVEILAKFPKGKVQLEIGVQTINPDTLKLINRGGNVDRVIENTARLKSLGNMHIHADLIAGLPGDEPSDIREAFDRLFGCCDMLQLGFLKLLRGSKLRAEVESFGCVFSDEPPYEVLRTDTLSYAELTRLHDIADLLERYFESGSFKRTLELAQGLCGSPFDLLAALADRLRVDGINVRELSQVGAYSALYDFLTCYYPLDKHELTTALSLDWLTSQNTGLPKFGELSFDKCELPELRRKFIDFAQKRGIECFAPSLEARESSYIVDRRNRRAFRAVRDGFVEV